MPYCDVCGMTTESNDRVFTEDGGALCPMHWLVRVTSQIDRIHFYVPEGLLGDDPQSDHWLPIYTARGTLNRVIKIIARKSITSVDASRRIPAREDFEAWLKPQPYAA